MKKFVGPLIAVGVAAAVVALVRGIKSRVTPEEQEERRAEKRRQFFDKMRSGMEAMPEDFPPKVMFDNIAAVRENTDRLLEILEGGALRREPEVVEV